MIRGKFLWIRNNLSTLTSQLVDSLAVVLITYYYTHAIQIPESMGVAEALIILILSNYVFKMCTALLDTLPFYAGVKFLTKYLNIDNLAEYRKNENYAGKES